MGALKKIIYIDDDAIMRMMFRKSLERSGEGFELSICADSTELMNSLQIFHPDLLIIDVNMPIINGPHILKNLRQQSYMFPAIFMSGHDHIDLPDLPILEPVLGFIHKPVSPLQLGATILKLWDTYQAKTHS